MDRGPFWVVRMPAYGSFRLDQNVCPSIKYLVISHGRVQVTGQIFSKEQNQNIKEALIGALLNIWWENRAIVLKLVEQEMAICSLLRKRSEMLYGNNILSTRFGNSMIFTILSLLWPKKKMSSLKLTCMIAISPLKSIIDDQISDLLSLSCTPCMELTTETVNCFKKVHLNFLYYSVLENNALHQTVLAIVAEESHTVKKEAQHNSPSHSFNIVWGQSDQFIWIKNNHTSLKFSQRIMRSRQRILQSPMLTTL